MNTKHKGDLAVAKAIAYYMEFADEVSLPIGDKRTYDIIVERNGRLYKVQCKYTSHLTDYGNFHVDLRTTGGNQSYHTVKKYKAGDFDLLFVLTEAGLMYEIPEGDILNRTTITLGPKYDSFKKAA